METRARCSRGECEGGVKLIKDGEVDNRFTDTNIYIYSPGTMLLLAGIAQADWIITKKKRI